MPAANNTATTTALHFVPSSSMLTDMVARAMAACDADCEQAQLRKEAQIERDAARAIDHEITVRARIRRWRV